MKRIIKKADSLTGKLTVLIITITITWLTLTTVYHIGKGHGDLEAREDILQRLETFTPGDQPDYLRKGFIDFIIWAKPYK